MNAWDFDKQYLWRFRARLLRTIDADTCVIEADCGFYGRHEVHIRLSGYSGPELHAPGGEDARAALDEALRLDDGSVWPLRVVSEQRETVVSEVRSFARYVARVLVAQPDGTLVDVTEFLP